MSLNSQPIVLIILDGFGIAPSAQSNAVSQANKPFFDSLTKKYPFMLLQASSEAVGLPWGEVGNSEVGHVNIGSGILRYQSLPRINKSISTGQFFKLPGLLETAKKVKQSGGHLHIMGMIGNGGVHSSQEHLEAMLVFAKNSGLKKQTYLHLFLDGRDTAKDTGQKFMEDVLKFSHKQKVGQVATICGRAIAMDRNNNWQKIEKAYQAIVNGQSDKMFRDPLQAIEESYKKKVYDEEFEPVVLTNRRGQPMITVEDGDAMVFFNFRADRARQLTKAIVLPDFDKFKTKKFKDLTFVAFTEYEKGLPVKVLFEPELIKNSLAKVFSDLNIKQLHVAETEKYAHVTFFFNGMIEEPFSGEERVLVPSPDVPSYDKQPEMSAAKVTEEVLHGLESEKFGFIVVNYANPDMVGHTGALKPCVAGIEAVDKHLKSVVEATLAKGGLAFVVADHGNAEEMFNLATGDIDKEHNMYPVPFIVVGQKFAGQITPEVQGGDLSLIQPIGILSDVAPTILELAGLQKPPEMTGTCLIK